MSKQKQLMWTRYYNEASEQQKQRYALQPEPDILSFASISGKPNGLYMSIDDDWIRWVRTHGAGLNVCYTHKKHLLNPADFFVLEITEDAIARYARPIPIPMLQGFKYIDWQLVRDVGYDGVHVPQEMINASMHLFHRYGVQLGTFDVETLVLWTAKEKVWSTLVAIHSGKI